MPCIMTVVDQFEWGGVGWGGVQRNILTKLTDTTEFQCLHRSGLVVTVTRLGNFLTKLTDSFHQELEMSDVLC